MFLFFLFAYALQYNPASKRKARRYKHKPVTDDEKPFSDTSSDFQFGQGEQDKFEEFPEKPEVYDFPGTESEKTEEPKQPQKNSKFPNTIELSNKSLICAEGYSSGRKITEKGCWKCYGCQANEICTFPGICSKANPTIKKAVVQNDQVVLNYEVDSNHFKPDFAFCDFDSKIITASKVTESVVSCPTPQEKVLFIKISFDGEEYSKSVKYPAPLVNLGAFGDTFGSLPIDRLIIIVGIFCILLYIFISIWNRPRRYYKLPVYMEAKPLAHFPQVDDTNEGPYSKMSVKF